MLDQERHASSSAFALPVSIREGSGIPPSISNFCLYLDSALLSKALKYSENISIVADDRQVQALCHCCHSIWWISTNDVIYIA